MCGDPVCAGAARRVVGRRHCRPGRPVQEEEGDPRSALTVADIAAQRAMLGPPRTAFPGISLVAEEDEAGEGECAGDVGTADGPAATAVATAAAVAGEDALRAETPAGLVTPPDLTAVPLDKVCLFY